MTNKYYDTEKYKRTAAADRKHDRSHGSPYDRGSADAYYGRPSNPHYYKWPKPGVFTMGERIEADKMTTEQVENYIAGYEEEESRKDYGA